MVIENCLRANVAAVTTKGGRAFAEAQLASYLSRQERKKPKTSGPNWDRKIAEETKP